MPKIIKIVPIFTQLFTEKNWLVCWDRVFSLAYLPHFRVGRNSSKPDFVEFGLAAVLFHEIHLFGGVGDCEQRLLAPWVEFSQQQFVWHCLVAFIQFFHDAGCVRLKCSATTRHTRRPFVLKDRGLEDCPIYIYLPSRQKTWPWPWPWDSTVWVVY